MKESLLSTVSIIAIHNYLYNKKVFYHYISEPVVISTPPIPLTLKENTEAIFSCIAKGKPTPSIVWIGPNGELPGNDTNIRIEIFEPTLTTKLSILIFMSLNYINHGNHSCEASNLAHGINNPLDVDIQPFTITVQSECTSYIYKSLLEYLYIFNS